MKQLSPLSTDPNGTVQVEMTTMEFLEILQSKQKKPKPNVAKGLNGIMDIFKCSKSTAFKIAHSEWFKPAILYRDGKFICFDVDQARRLALEYTQKQL